MNIITVSSKGEHSMAMDVRADGEDKLSNKGVPQQQCGDASPGGK